MLKNQKEELKRKEKNKRLYKMYGITIEQWEDKFKEQGKICACCKTLPGTGRLNVDHIHIKGFKKMSPEEKVKYIRGLCCFMCNTAFKAVEKTSSGKRNREMLNGINEYFKKYKLKGEI
jgi:Recombination endonuclease VII